MMCLSVTHYITIITINIKGFSDIGTKNKDDIESGTLKIKSS